MDKQGRWDLSFFYTGFDDPRLAADFAALPGMMDELEKLLKADLPDGEKLEKLLDASEAIAVVSDRAGSFCFLNNAVDAGNTDALRYMDQLMTLNTRLGPLMSAISRYAGSLEGLDELIEGSEKLRGVAFALREMREKVKHLIPEQLEKWVLKMSLSGGRAFSQLRDKLDATHLIDFRGEKLPLSAVRGKAYDPDPAVRREAYEAEIASYARIEIPMAACLNSVKMEARTLAEMRGYASVLDMTLDESRMDRQTLDAMFTAIGEALPHFRRYLRAKGRLLGHGNGIPFYDLFAPVGKSAKTYTAQEARELLVREMGKFTPEMAKFIDNAFEHDWIDLYPRSGKSGGAFCAPAHFADRSLVMTNFQGSFSDVGTIAHELGHAWHNRCLAGLPYALIDTPMQLAETASIFNETMLGYQVQRSCGEDEKLALLESGLMEATQTVVDIYSRYLFETEVIETRADHAMSVDELKDAMLRAQDATYGDGLDPEVRHPYMWACKSHYYSSGLNFYNFPYAFGLLYGKGVFARWLEKGDAFVPDYCRMLRMCGSASIADVAATMGIDVRSVDFWRSSLDVIRRDADEFCRLCGE